MVGLGSNLTHSIPPDDIVIYPLSERHNISSFFSSDLDLNDFLLNDALESQEQKVSTTYVTYYENKLVGFFTLTTDIIEVKDVGACDRWTNYEHKRYPAVKLARLAVD
ncbi:hypothetical protein [Methanococcoides sp. NM1]|uniref:hypothetical protein n=1 Tax=Methanococcoides sp. NM1 TaxID=1201013 RepID=UPI00108409B2|nr:hypothetical protein [Methanococcoides sp. NM1]